MVNQSDCNNEQHRHLKDITKVYKAFWVDMELNQSIQGSTTQLNCACTCDC